MSRMIAWLARGGRQRRAHFEFNHTYSAFPAFTFEMDESGGRDILSIRESLLVALPTIWRLWGEGFGFSLSLQNQEVTADE